jgi:predicted nucleotidyltransferase
MERERMISEMRRVLRENGIRKAYLFGSFARKEKGYKDIDVAIDLPKKFSLLDMVGVQLELEERLGKKIDLVSYRDIKPALRPYIEKDLAAIA